MSEKKRDWHKLKGELDAGEFERLYVFHGEETYLREHYLSMLIRRAVGDQMPEFNVKSFQGALSLQQLADAVESFPMMCERTVVAIRDFDVFKLDEKSKQEYLRILSDLPEHCSVVLVYHDLNFKPDRRKKLDSELLRHMRVVEFLSLGREDLISWVRRRFSALNKDIGRDLADFFIFYCGELMHELIPEIEKTAAYTRKREITKKDIEAVATPSSNVIIFELTDALAERNYARAFGVADKLRESREPMIPMLAMIARQLRQLYHARLLFIRGGGMREIMQFWGVREYAARRIAANARELSTGWILFGIRLCEETDYALKTSAAEDSAIDMIIARLSVYPGGAVC